MRHRVGDTRVGSDCGRHAIDVNVPQFDIKGRNGFSGACDPNHHLGEAGHQERN